MQKNRIKYLQTTYLLFFALSVTYKSSADRSGCRLVKVSIDFENVDSICKFGLL